MNLINDVAGVCNQGIDGYSGQIFVDDEGELINEQTEVEKLAFYSFSSNTKTWADTSAHLC